MREAEAGGREGHRLSESICNDTAVEFFPLSIDKDFDHGLDAFVALIVFELEEVDRGAFHSRSDHRVFAHMEDLDSGHGDRDVLGSNCDEFGSRITGLVSGTERETLLPCLSQESGEVDGEREIVHRRRGRFVDVLRPDSNIRVAVDKFERCDSIVDLVCTGHSDRTNCRTSGNFRPESAKERRLLELDRDNSTADLATATGSGEESDGLHDGLASGVLELYGDRTVFLCNLVLSRESGKSAAGGKGVFASLGGLVHGNDLTAASELYPRCASAEVGDFLNELQCFPLGGRYSVGDDHAGLTIDDLGVSLEFSESVDGRLEGIEIGRSGVATKVIDI